MKLDLKSWLLISAAVIIIVLLLYIKGCGGTTVISSDKTDSLSWINKLGDSVKSVIGTKDALASENVQLRDSIARINNFNKDKVDFLLAANVFLQKQLEDQEPAVIVEPPGIPVNFDNPPVLTRKIVDSIKAAVSLQHTFRDRFDTVDVTLGARNKLSLKATSEMTAVSGWVKQKGWFKPDLYRVDLSFTNPYLRVNGLRSFVAPPAKPKKFGIGVQIGYGWQSGLKPQPYIGAGIQYNLIRF